MDYLTRGMCAISRVVFSRCTVVVLAEKSLFSLLLSCCLSCKQFKYFTKAYVLDGAFVVTIIDNIQQIADAVQKGL